jgi:hypothetical protein
MIARLVALMASIRPTVRRVTETLATPARTNISTRPSRSAVSIMRANASRSSMAWPTSSREPSPRVATIARTSGASAAGVPSRAERSRSASHGETGRPGREIAGEARARGVDEQILPAGETRSGSALLDRGNQSSAACGVMGVQQHRPFRRNGAIGAAAHERVGGHVDVAEQTNDRGAEDGDGEQRQPKGRRAERLSQEHGGRTPRRERYG